MYRYGVDQLITYTSEDFVLFRESPFASWMERLTLENPDHGILPDVTLSTPDTAGQSENDLASTLQNDGKEVLLIKDDDETIRRTATLAAMRHGVDFIFNGQLAVGPLSDSSNLLMRTSGYSELGSYLYIPCDTHAKTTLNSAFRLCFLADLLHDLQGQLPPQMLILRTNSAVLPLQTEDHIFHYRAVKQRFMTAQRSFKKHRMPDPVEAAHFGRWADCANEVLKQRALGKPERTVFTDTQGEESDKDCISAAPLALSQLAVSSVAQAVSLYDLDDLVSEAVSASSIVEGTLAEQAQKLHADAFPGRSNMTDTGNEPGIGHLQHLAFIGSSTQTPSLGANETETVPLKSEHFSEAPPATLRSSAQVDLDVNLEMSPAPLLIKRPSVPFSDILMTHSASDEK